MLHVSVRARAHFGFYVWNLLVSMIARCLGSLLLIAPERLERHWEPRPMVAKAFYQTVISLISALFPFVPLTIAVRQMKEETQRMMNLICSTKEKKQMKNETHGLMEHCSTE